MAPTSFSLLLPEPTHFIPLGRKQPGSRKPFSLRAACAGPQDSARGTAVSELPGEGEAGRGYGHEAPCSRDRREP